MKPVYQRFISGSPKPDCMAACIASIFEIDPREIPNLFIKREQGNWLKAINDFTKAKVGKFTILTSPDMYPKDEYYMTSIVFRGNSIPHAMVAYNDTLVHCPAYAYFYQEGPIKMEDFFRENQIASVYHNYIFIDKETLIGA